MTLEEFIKKLENLSNDEWNVDDTICQQNMMKIQKLIKEFKSENTNNYCNNISTD